MSISLAGRTALVTGGARGIGLEISRQLIAQGCRVVAVGRNTRHLDALKAEGGKQVAVIQADLSQQTEIDRLITRLTAEHPDISILINNAGIQREMDLFHDPLTETIPGTRREIALNLDGLICLTLGLLPVLSAQKSAHIVNITSALAVVPKAASPVYCATKAAARSFTTTLRYQCEDHAPHVKVSEAIMALVDTDMTAGRGTRKISAHVAAKEVIAGLARGRREIWVGKTKILRILHRALPAVAASIMR
ncbi:SDR family NAD(P)-dependent oxidoreductase [Pseudosulfitobacter sp. DSM 107133]|uniref:SDR family oxidoreductase n=1 Tax=Pseudosulfitobacter sp. DSM 107133 TaxID=2883100 RepID=UPI000DF34115|nr:SDR family NAD(P)-dependent oxidoreductase [Pseudosulfitobacter sp. DSM 107133]UOA25673.1 NADP-dependent 3-hydroxy acid dehydrogenase YdfG [Pseudosulfitobacter sp. DSM 107133]